jgi:hypothetical protein
MIACGASRWTTPLARNLGIVTHRNWSKNLRLSASWRRFPTTMAMSMVAGALDDPPVMHGDCRIDQVAPQGPEPGEDAILIRARKPGVADHIGYQERREFPGLGHGVGSRSRQIAGREGLGMAAFPRCIDRDAAGRECRPGFWGSA